MWSGNTSSLTTNTDNITGTSSNDSINGSSATFNSDDVINGGAGSDTLTVTVAPSSATSVIANLTNVETVRVTNGGSAAQTLNMIGATGVSELNSRLSGADVTFSNVQAAATVSAFGTTAGTTTATFLNSLASGTSDSVSLKADGGATATFAVTGTGTGRFETINLQSAGSQKNTVALDTTASGTAASVKNLNVTGSADLAITLASGATSASYDGSAASGAQSITTGASSNFKTIKGGTGADTIDLSAATSNFSSSTAALAIDGGAGNDTLVIAENLSSLTSSTTGVKHSISNIETVQQNLTDATAGAIDASLVGSATVYAKLASASATSTATLDAVSNLAAGQKVQVSGSVGGSANAASTRSASVALKDASGTADSVTVESVAPAAGSVSNFSTITVGRDGNSNAVETLNLVATAADVTASGTTTAGTTLAAVSAQYTNTMNISGAGGVVIGTVQLAQPTTGTATIDGSAMTGNLTLGASGADFKNTDADKVYVKLGAGTNAVYALDISVDSDTVEGATGNDTLYLTEGNSTTALKTTVKNIDNVQITAIANDRDFDLTNWSQIGKITLVGTNTGSEDVVLTNVAAGQAIEIKTSTASSNAQLVDVVTLKGATGVTASSVTLTGDTAQAALALNASTASVSVVDNIKDTSGYFKNNQVTVDGTASTAKVTSVTLSGGGKSSATATAAFDLRTGTNVAIATVDATALSSNLKIDNATLATGAAVKLGAGDNTVTVSAAEMARDALKIDGGAGSDTLAVTLADATAAVSLRPGLTAVETIDVTMSAAVAGAFDNNLDLTDATGVTGFKVALTGTDDNLKVTAASGAVSLKLAGSQAAATNVVSIAGATGLTVTNTAAIGGTQAADLTAADATSVTIKQANSSNIAFDDLTFAKATSLTVGGADKDSTGTAYSGTITANTLTAGELTSLTVDSTEGKVTLSTVTAAKLAAVTVTGSGGLDFGLTDGTTNALASFDASAATGGVSIGQGVDFTSAAIVKLGSGNDTITLDILTEGGVAVDGGSKAGTTGDSDTLKLAGANNLGLTVVDLTANDQISQLNGSLNAAVQSNFENIDLSGLTGSFGANITGTTKANTIVGSKNADNIVGNGGADTITGGAGADTIDVTRGSSDTAVIQLIYAASGDSAGGAGETGTAAIGNMPTSGFDVITGLKAGDSIKLSGGSTAYTAISSATTFGTSATLNATTTALDVFVFTASSKTYLAYETAVGTAANHGAYEVVEITGVSATKFVVSAAGLVTFS